MGCLQKNVLGGENRWKGHVAGPCLDGLGTSGRQLWLVRRGQGGQGMQEQGMDGGRQGRLWWSWQERGNQLSVWR